MGKCRLAESGALLCSGSSTAFLKILLARKKASKRGGGAAATALDEARVFRTEKSHDLVRLSRLSARSLKWILARVASSNCDFSVVSVWCKQRLFLAYRCGRLFGSGIWQEPGFFGDSKNAGSGMAPQFRAGACARIRQPLRSHWRES
jgi:hypothetical protein